jgi:hypothetical protein
METLPSFHTLWNQVETFVVEESQVDEKALWCGYAREFSNWLDEYILSKQDYDLIGINQAKIIILDKYLAWRSFVPKGHQDRIGSRGHTCIFHVFITACEQLLVAELRLHQPRYFIPPPPPSRPVPRGPALFLSPLEDGD